MLSKKSLDFLDDLAKNNNRDWFQSQKTRYEAYKADYHAIISEFLNYMKPQDPALELLEIKNCTFRINRDIRFSKNKMPYKTHMGIWMTTNPGGKNAPGYYIHLERGKSFMAGGIYSPESDDLKKIRKEIAFYYDDLSKIVSDKNFKKYFNALDTKDSLKNAPKGFEKDHPAIEFLKLKSFTASLPISDSDLLNKDFIKNASQKLGSLRPLIEFLNRGLSGE